MTDGTNVRQFANTVRDLPTPLTQRARTNAKQSVAGSRFPGMDFEKFDPAPRAKRMWRHGPKPFYLNMVAGLHSLAESADLNDPSEFHPMLWMVVQFGGSQKFIAYDQGVSPAMVSRWVQGDQTPVASRRRGILLSALVSLLKAVEEGSPVPLRKYHGRRARTLQASVASE